jgi:hypothetical protein
VTQGADEIGTFPCPKIDSGEERYKVGLSSAGGQEGTVRPQRTMSCLFVRTQFTVPISSAPCCLRKFGGCLRFTLLFEIYVMALGYQFYLQVFEYLFEFKIDIVTLI